MRLLVCIIVLFLFASSHLGARDIVHFRLSKPYCLLNFLNTCGGERGTSDGLKVFIDKKDVLKNSAFNKILARYQAIPLDYTYERGQFPSSRRSRYGRTTDMILYTAVQCDNLDQLNEKLIGLLPNVDHLQLMKALNDAMPIYDSLIWRPNHDEFEAQFKVMQGYQSRINALFSQLNHFYKASWPNEIPFTVTLYPVPGGRRTGTAATPHGNALCVGMRIGDKDYDMIAGVILHEMCHELYNEQPANTQTQFEQLFLTNKSAYSKFAYSYIDEGLATACGNGWANEKFSGKPDKGQWYNDKYIDAYGKGLYPLVKKYLDAGKAIDSDFVDKAINVFATLFPKAPSDYDLLFNSINLYMDDGSDEKRKLMTASLYKHFNVSSCNTSYPLLDPVSLNLLENSPATQLIIITENETANLAKLYELFPDLKKVLKEKAAGEFIAEVQEAKGRVVLVVKIKEVAALEKAFLLLRKQQYMEKDAPFHEL